MNDRMIHKLLRSTLTETEEDYQPTALETYITSVFGCRLTSRQRQKLSEIVTAPGRNGITVIGAANDLYDNDIHFPDYVQSKVDWALSTGHNLTQAVNRTRAVGAICKFFHPYYGWLVYKQRRLDERNERRGDPQSHWTEETGDGGSEGTHQPTANPTLGEFLATMGKPQA